MRDIYKYAFGRGGFPYTGCESCDGFVIKEDGPSSTVFRCSFDREYRHLYASECEDRTDAERNCKTIDEVRAIRHRPLPKVTINPNSFCGKINGFCPAAKVTDRYTLCLHYNGGKAPMKARRPDLDVKDGALSVEGWGNARVDQLPHCPKEKPLGKKWVKK